MARIHEASNRGDRMTKRNTHMQRSKSLEERFNEKVDRTQECWLWTSAIGSKDYGMFWIGQGKSIAAHRVAFALSNPGVDMLPGLLVMHSCDNPPSRKGRTARGERNGGGGKLTEQDAQEILASRGTMSCVRAAVKYGVSAGTIKSIRRGKIWNHLSSPVVG